MIVSDPRRRPLPRNVPVEFSDENPKGHSCPSANALKDGPDSEVTRVPEDSDAVVGRTGLWFPSFKAQTCFHAWLIDQVSITTLRIERVARIERRIRDRNAARAVLFWDDDRKLDAEALGAELDDDPAATVNRLRRTPQGCDWLIDRWARLAYIAESGGGWNDDHRALAFGLLGVAPGDRVGDPGTSINLEGRPLDPVETPAGLARREVAALLVRRDEVAGPDRTDRALAEADLIDDPSPEFRALRRHDRTLHDRLKWIVRQIQHDSPRKATNASLIPYLDPQAPSELPPALEIGPPPEPDLGPEPKSVPPPKPTLSSIDPGPAMRRDRTEAKLKKAETRRLARQRKQARRRK